MAVDTPGLIQVEGLARFDRAVKEFEPEVHTELRIGLREAAEPVREKAADLSKEKISGMARAVRSSWWEMKLGGGIYVYVAPASRNKGGSPRPNLARLLMNKGMRPGLAAEEPVVAVAAQKAVERAIESVGL